MDIVELIRVAKVIGIDPASIVRKVQRMMNSDE
jgi:hypothetical protein